jgi:hypothetical protein
LEGCFLTIEETPAGGDETRRECRRRDPNSNYILTMDARYLYATVAESG